MISSYFYFCLILNNEAIAIVNEKPSSFIFVNKLCNFLRAIVSGGWVGILWSPRDLRDMAGVSISHGRFTPKMSASYCPAIPPKAPKAAMSYSQ